MVNILCIDPGLINLGFCYVDISDEIVILERKRVDVMKKKTISDSIDHFCETYSNYFEHAYEIVIERQPPTGAALVVQELIYSKYKDKIKFLHPSTVAAYFGTYKLKYNDRKKENREYVNNYFGINETSFDVCDSLCLAIYYKSNCPIENLRKFRYNPFTKFSYRRKKKLQKSI